MTFEVTIAILFAALLHAGWNALVKVQGDRLVVMATFSLFGSLFSLLFVPFVSFPASSSWLWLGITIILHTVYHLFLAAAYEHGDLGQVYPIARGSAPLLVALGAYLFAGEQLSPVSAVGVLCLASGVMTLAFEKGSGLKQNPRAIMFALMTGVMISSYTVVDGIGVRSAGTALGFAVWMSIGDGVLTFAVVYLLKRGQGAILSRRYLKLGMIGSVMQTGAYWIILWAVMTTPMAMVSALRETSVLFAAVISTFLLHEGFGVWRFISAGLVTLGLIATRTRE